MALLNIIKNDFLEYLKFFGNSTAVQNNFIKENLLRIIITF